VVFLGIVLFIIIDFESALEIFNSIIEFIKEHPYEAIAVVIVSYIFLIVFLLPITYLLILCGFAYCKAFDSFGEGFAWALLASFIGIMLGSLCAFLLGRYLLSEFLNRKIRKSKSSIAKDWIVIDNMFITNGILFVALVRLMFLPYGPTCYALSATSVTLLDYMLGSFFYVIKIAMLVVFGCSLYQAVDNPGDTGSTVLLIVDIVLTLTASIIIIFWAKYEFERRY